MEELVGRSLNRYQILSILGEGGIGAVYKARDTVLQRDIAIKVMRPKFAQREDFRNRFLMEARTAARLDHPSIVRVHDFGEDGDLLYIVMEYIPGDNLRRMLQNMRAQNQWVVLSEAIVIVQQVCQALEYALTQGVLHRDVKPDNLMLKPEGSADSKQTLPYRVIITDLGLAQLIGEEQVMVDNGSMGTPAYMSPEQALGQKTDARSDVYSVGVLLYELATGRLPFPAKTIAEAVYFHTREPVPLPRTFRPELPITIQDIILKAMEKDSNKRYANTGEMGHALEAVLPAARQVDDSPTDVSQTVSLLTQYDERPTEAAEVGPQKAEFPDDAAIRNDYIEVLLPDRSIRNVPMKAEGLTIGRERSSDISVDHPRLSRQHARIEYHNGGYWVSDLNSLNGTFLNGTRLTPGVPVVWTPDKTLQVGEIFLRLKRPFNEQTQAAPPNQVLSNPVSTLAGQALVPSTGQVELFMETVQLAVTPGTSANLNIVVMNRGATNERVRLTVGGIPPNWMPTPPPVLALQPGSQQEVQIPIQPPQTYQTRPGRYPLTVQAYTASAPGQPVEVKGTLTVGVYNRFSSDLRPKRLEADSLATVTVQNLGNARQSFVINPLDPMDAVIFDPPQARINLTEGEMASAEFRATPRSRPLFGGPRVHAFNVQVNTPSGDGQSHSGEVVNPGILPFWMLPLLLSLCLCLTFFAAFAYNRVFAKPSEASIIATQTQLGSFTQLALMLTQQPTMAANTARAATYTAAAVLSLTPPATATPTITPTPTQTVTPTPTLSPSPSPSSTTAAPAATTQVVIIPSSTFTPSPTPTATATNTETKAAPSPTPVGGFPLIAFSSNRDGNGEIYVMLNNGTLQTRITNNPADDTHPSWSPDRTRLIFASHRDGRWQIYVMNADGSGQSRVSNSNADDTNPSWSPDGSHIVFTSNRDGNKEIYAMVIDGSNQTRLTNNNVEDDHASWSPDGSKIAFDSGNPSARSIMVMGANGSNPTDLTKNGAVNSEPDWSPDGSRIAYVSNQGGGATEIYIMAADGSGQNKYTNLNTQVSRPWWSRDGHWITFRAETNGTGEIYIMTDTGQQLSNLTNNGAEDADPTW